MTILSVKIKQTRDHYSYKNKINAEDYRLVAQLLADLEAQGVPMRKACEAYISKKWLW